MRQILNHESERRRRLRLERIALEYSPKLIRKFIKTIEGIIVVRALVSDQ